nr:hypothetical protein [uncultured Campylobacter sp.]
MDKSRLEELKKLLNERRGGAKQNLDRELDAENFEIENFEVSNFEALNSEASNFESLNSEVSNSKPSNFEASNSENINSDPDALNLEIGVAQNSACKNSAEQQILPQMTAALCSRAPKPGTTTNIR